MQVTTKNTEQTLQLGKTIGELSQPGDVFLLIGELGTGKTLFTKGIGTALAIPAERIISPSFTIIFEYTSGKMPLYHIDFYRLNRLADLEYLGLERYLQGDGLLVIEWADRMTGGLPPDTMEIHFYWEGEHERRLEFLPKTPRWQQLLPQLPGV